MAKPLFFHCRGHGFNPGLGKLRSHMLQGVAKNTHTQNKVSAFHPRGQFQPLITSVLASERETGTKEVGGIMGLQRPLNPEGKTFPLPHCSSEGLSKGLCCTGKKGHPGPPLALGAALRTAHHFLPYLAQEQVLDQVCAPET